MSVFDTHVIDIIGTDKTTGECILTITDHLSWDDPNHLITLQDKLNAYLAFIESGEILKKYPESGRQEIRIQLVTKYEPNDSARNFLARVQSTIQSAGYAFSWGIAETRGVT